MYLCANLIKLDIVYVLSLQSVIISQPLFSAIEPQAAATQQEIKFLLKYFKRVGMSSLYIYIIYTLWASVHDRMVLEKETCKLWYCFKTHKNYSNNLCSLNQSSNRKCLQIGGQRYEPVYKKNGFILVLFNPKQSNIIQCTVIFT